MKHCVQYPDDKFFAVRPCLVAICLGNRPAGKLLGALLYRYNLRVENKDDAENHNAIKAAQGKRPDQDTSYRIFRKQAQFVEDMCGEIDEKTLHDVAVPMLQMLGFLDIEEHIQANCYIVNVELVQQALDLYIPGHKQQPDIKAFVIAHAQLEKFLISVEQLEKSLIDRKTFLLQLEKVLIWNRNISNCKRGRKPKPKAEAEATFQSAQNLEEESKKTREETGFSDAASAHRALPDFSFEQYQSLPMPVTVEQARAYLVPHGPCDESDTEALLLAIKLWREAHEPDEQPQPIRLATSEAAATAMRNEDTDENTTTAHRGGSSRNGDTGGHLGDTQGTSHLQRVTAHPQPEPRPQQQEIIPLPVVESAGMPPSDQPTPTSGKSENYSQKTREVTQGKAGKHKVVEVTVTAEEQTILDMWQSLFKRRIPVTEALVKAAGRLVPCEPTLQDLKDCKGFCFASNPDWFRRTGVQLSNVVDNWAKWQTTLDLPEETPAPGARSSSGGASNMSNNHVISSFSTPGYDFASDGFYPSEAERREQYATADW